SLLVIPVGGILSDRLGRKRVYLAACMGMAIFSYPVFLLLSQGTFAAALEGQLVFAVLLGLAGGVLPAMFVELFPTRTRYSGIAIGYNLAQALLGGTAPLVATWLISATGSNFSPAYYLIGFMLLAIIAALCIEDRYREPLT